MKQEVKREYSSSLRAETWRYSERMIVAREERGERRRRV